MIDIRIPASSANIGPGYDCFGIAFQLYNHFRFEEKQDGKLTIRGVTSHYQGKRNLVYRAMERVFLKIGYIPKGLNIICENDIPQFRGLGSSATCIIAGMTAANILAGEPLASEEIFKMAVEMEGHPDNIAPSFYGGLVAAMTEHGKTLMMRNTVAENYRFFVLIPDYTLSTRALREVLPHRIAHDDAAYNVSHAVLTYLALMQNRPDILATAMQDKLHQPYRKRVIEGYDTLEKEMLSAGAVGVCISGSGPAILAITDEARETYFNNTMREWVLHNYPRWQFENLLPDDKGMIVTKKS